MRTLYLLFTFFILLACNQVQQSTAPTDEAPPVEEVKSPYPDVSFDFLQNRNLKSDTIPNRALVEILLDEQEQIQWRINEQTVEFDQIIDRLNQIIQTFPEREKNIFIVDLGIDEKVPFSTYLQLKNSLRDARRLKVSFLNRDNEKLLARYPPSLNKTTGNGPPPPPPPPGSNSKDVTCICCKENGKYFTKFGRKSAKFYDSHRDCLLASMNPKYLAFVELKNNQYYWNAQPTDLVSLNDSLKQKYAHTDNPQKFILSYDSDTLSTYGNYLKAYAICQKTFADRQHKYAMETFGKAYSSLSEKEQRAVRTKFPYLLSENTD